MTSLKDQMKLLKDAGKGVTEGFTKYAKETVVLPEVKNLFKGIKSGTNKLLKGEKQNEK